MSKTIFEKLSERIKERKFNLIKADYMGHKIRMYGLLLSKAEWKQYQRVIPDIVLREYTDKKVMWYRGYPLKQKQ